MISSMINNFVAQTINKEGNVSPDSRWVLANRNRNLTRVSSHVCFHNTEGVSIQWGVNVYVFGKEYNVESILRGPSFIRHLNGFPTSKKIPSHINSVSRIVFSPLFFKGTGWYAVTLLSYGGKRSSRNKGGKDEMP